MATVWHYSFWISLGLLGYALVGYPLLLIAVSRFRRNSPATQETEQLPAVTLVIPAYNEEGVLQAKLENALAIDYPRDRIEILVASDGSADRTAAIAREFRERGVQVAAFDERRGKAAVMNDAVAAASGDVICLCDANVFFRSDALRQLVKRLADPSIGAVTGDVRLASDEANFGQGEESYYKIEKRLQVAESQVGSVMGVDGGMYILRHELFQPIPADTILDDFVLSMRVLRQGKRVVYEPQAVAHENGTPKAAQEYRRRVRVAAGAVQSIKRGERPPLAHGVEFWQYLSHKLLRWLGPLWLIVLFAANVALLPEGDIYRVILAAQIIAYLLAVAGLVSVRFRGTRLGGVPFYFALSHVAMAVGTFKGIFNLQQVTWRRADRPVIAGTGEREVPG